MKNHFGSLFFVLSLLFFAGCEKENLNATDSLRIEFGSVCGWCAGEEKITISQSKIEYARIIPCGENEGKTEIIRSVNSEQWENLISAFDFDYFLTLNYNECNVCVDGCDEFIIITKDGETHEINYNPGMEIEGIENFQEKLQDLIDSFREEN